MGYDIAAFKAAFGYGKAVVGQLVEVMRGRAKEDESLNELLAAVDLQYEYLDKTEKLSALERKQRESGLDLRGQIDLRGLRSDVDELGKQLDAMGDAESQLQLLEELNNLERQKASASNPMHAQLSEQKIRKVKTSLGVPSSFTTLTGVEEEHAGPSLEEVMKGGGELELKDYVGSDGKTYTVEKAISGGGHSAFKIVDKSNGQAFLWKPSTDEMMLEAEVGASKLASLLMPGYCPPCEKLTIDGKSGSCQPFIPEASDLTGIEDLDDSQKDLLAAHMMTDWLISNHDNHVGQFMVNSTGVLFGIDKGQAFKHFKQGDVESSFVKQAKDEMAAFLKINPEGKETEKYQKLQGKIAPEHLDPSYFPSTNFGSPVSGDLMKILASSMNGPSRESGFMADVVKRAKGLTLEQAQELFGEYAKRAFPGQEDAFLQAVVERAHGLEEQVKKMQFNAPELADHHMEQVNELLTFDLDFKPGAYPQLAQEIGPLRQAVKSLKKVEGIGEASPDDEDDTLYVLKVKLESLEEALTKLEKVYADCQASEKFLSGDYRRVSPLLGAFAKLGVEPEVYADPQYNYASIDDRLLDEWKAIALARNYATKDATDSWDKTSLEDTYEIVRSMGRAWEAFPVPDIPRNRTARGDVSEHLFQAYPAIDPNKLELEDGEHDISYTVKWPGVMSTTVGDPMSHNFISAKSFIWVFDVQQPCVGRVIGDINPSEQEVTFPTGVKVEVTKLVVRKGDDKSYRADEFGTNAIAVAFAKLG